MKLSVEELSFSYGRKAVLHQVSFSLEQGEILCVLGPNGVGKSTLFRCILGLQQGYSGHVRLGEDEVSGLKPRELARRIAYIPQFSAPVFQYSVFQVVLMGTTSQLDGLSSPGERQQRTAMEALDRLGIGHLRERKASTLSGGERQLVLIARALAQKAPLLVMDEPTASLDYGNAIRVMEMVRTLASQGCGIILSTHNPDQVLRYGSRALILGGGRVESFGPPETAVNAAVLSKVYGVPIEVAPLTVGQTLQRVCVPACST